MSFFWLKVTAKLGNQLGRTEGYNDKVD